MSFLRKRARMGTMVLFALSVFTLQLAFMGFVTGAAFFAVYWLCLLSNALSVLWFVLARHRSTLSKCSFFFSLTLLIVMFVFFNPADAYSLVLNR